MARMVTVDEKVLLGWMCDLSELVTAVQDTENRVAAALEELGGTDREYARLGAKMERLRQGVVEALDRVEEK